MKGLFFESKDDVGKEKMPLLMNDNLLLRKKGEIRTNMPNSGKPYSKYYLDDESYEVGGVVKHKHGVTMDGKDGGLFKGRPHSEGGIKAINVDTNTPIEVEGGEVVITKDAVADTTKRDFMGKKMTNKEILSYINQSGGGVALEKGGHIMEDGGMTEKPNFDSILDQATDSNGLNDQDSQKLDSIIELLQKQVAFIKVQLSVLSNSTETQKFTELSNKLSQTSNALAKYVTARNWSNKKNLEHFLNSLYERGNAYNILRGEVVEEPKKINAPFSEAIYTENFKLWFGDWEVAKATDNYVNVSKAVDSNGNPEIYFHGGRQYQTTYYPHENISVFYWAKKFSYAEWFAENAFASGVQDSVILRAYIDCKNPIDLTIFGSRPIDMGDIVRYLMAFYPQSNIKSFLPKQYLKLLNEQKPFNITIRAWQIIRQFNDWVKHVRDNTVFDGFMYEENNPSQIINGVENTTPAFAVFNSNQIKFPNQFGFSTFLDDFRFEEGGILI